MSPVNETVPTLNTSLKETSFALLIVIPVRVALLPTAALNVISLAVIPSIASNVNVLLPSTVPLKIIGPFANNDVLPDNVMVSIAGLSPKI